MKTKYQRYVASSHEFMLTWAFVSWRFKIHRPPVDNERTVFIFASNHRAPVYLVHLLQNLLNHLYATLAITDIDHPRMAIFGENEFDTQTS